MPAYVFAWAGAGGRACSRPCHLSGARRFNGLATDGHYSAARLYVCHQQSLRFSRALWTRAIACWTDHSCSQRDASSPARALSRGLEHFGAGDIVNTVLEAPYVGIQIKTSEYWWPDISE